MTLIIMMVHMTLTVTTIMLATMINSSNCSHIEFEDSEEEAGDTVVTGGLKLGHKGGDQVGGHQVGDQVGGQVRPGQTKMPTDGLTSSISRFHSI